MTGLFNAVSGIDTGNERVRNDYYPTPPEATQALLQSDFSPLGFKRMAVWEPACGCGAIVRELEATGYDVVATDVEPRDCGEKLNFFNACEPLAEAIVTNPPFAIAANFIQHAHALNVDYLALLLKATYWHAGSRLGLFRQRTPRAVLPLPWRVDFTGEGASPMDFSWYVWTPTEPVTEAIYHVLDKPTDCPLFTEATA